MKHKLQKRFIVRKYITASSALNAIRKDRTAPVDDVWVDNQAPKDMNPAIGFEVIPQDNDE
jgi:hypothetical protein